MAFLFPGQGSQHVGMGEDVANRYPESRSVFDEADCALGFSISQLCFEGAEEEICLTENAQPSILTTSIALYRALESKGIVPDVVAGHSLGEYSALVVAGAISLSDAVILVRKRGQYMQEAVPVGVGAMAAILGLSADDVSLICEETAGVISPANLNGAHQVVIAGETKAVEFASVLARERGARRVIPLRVSAPFHCELMKPAADRLAQELQHVPFTDLQLPVYTNVDAAQIRTGSEACDALERQVSSPVRWEETINAMVEDRVQRFVEVGPGQVLSGLVRKMFKDVEVITVNSVEGIEALIMEAEGA